MIDLKKISKLTTFYCGTDCENYANATTSIEEFIKNAEAEWLLVIAEEIASQFIGFAAPVQNQEEYNEIRKKIVLALVDCALLESDRYNDEQLDLLWVAEEWAKGNAHDDDFQSAKVKSLHAYEYQDRKKEYGNVYEREAAKMPYKSAKAVWFVFKNENHAGLVSIMANFIQTECGKSAALEFKKECAEICREFLGELIINYYNNNKII